MNKHFFLFFLFLFTTLFIKAQAVISSQVDSYYDSTASIDFTIGEVVTFTRVSVGNNLTQGFQKNHSY